jgi:hypothetical protein
MSAVPVHSGGMAAGAVNTMRQLGYAFGIAVLGSVFSARVGQVVTHQGGRPSVAQAISGGQAQRLLAGLPAGQRDALNQVVHAASAAGLNAALLLAGALGLAGSLIVLATLRRPPSHPPSSGAGRLDAAGLRPTRRTTARLTTARLTTARAKAPLLRAPAPPKARRFNGHVSGRFWCVGAGKDCDCRAQYDEAPPCMRWRGLATPGRTGPPAGLAAQPPASLCGPAHHRSLVPAAGAGFPSPARVRGSPRVARLQW